MQLVYFDLLLMSLEPTQHTVELLPNIFLFLTATSRI